MLACSFCHKEGMCDDPVCAKKRGDRKRRLGIKPDALVGKSAAYIDLALNERGMAVHVIRKQPF